MSSHPFNPKPPEEVKIVTARMSPAMHKRIGEAAHREHTSMNKYVLAAIEAALSESEGAAAIAEQTPAGAPAQQ